MRRLIPAAVVLGLVTAGLALAQNIGTLSSKTFSVAADAGLAPTLDSDGVDLGTSCGWRTIVSAKAGRTLGTTGSALCYFYGAVSSTGVQGAAVTRRWQRCQASFDVTPLANVRDYPSRAYQDVMGAGRIAYVPNLIKPGGTVDAGADDYLVDVTIEVRKCSR